MVSNLLAIGLLAAVWVGFNIGGSSTAVAWGPAVGSGVVTKIPAAVLMTGFVFLGGLTVGRNVIRTLGSGIVRRSVFTPKTTIVVLIIIGLGMFIGNAYSVPVSTSMSAVGAIAGLGIATETLNWSTMGRILTWWIVTPIVGFWASAVVGRYIYPYLDSYTQLEQSEGPLVVLDRSGLLPRPGMGPNTTLRELVSTLTVLAIACYMAFSAGASNVANAVAPLVGSGAISIEAGIILGTVAISIGAFTIARRTLDTVGGGITDLPLLASLVVMVVAATITTLLSWLGIPISLAVTAMMTIIGLGWGRASRIAKVRKVIYQSEEIPVSSNALNVESSDGPSAIGEEVPEDILNAEDLYDQKSVARVISLLIISPSAAALISYVVFISLPLALSS